MFKPFSPFSILFLHNGAMKEWSMGRSGWLRALSAEEKRASEWRMAEAGATRLLGQSIETDRLWVCGCDPSGIPIGLVGGSLRLPEHPEYACNGWLDPDGRFYPCGRGEHENLSEALHRTGSVGLDDLGWSRVVEGAPINDGLRHITIGQRGWLRRPAPVRLDMGRIC